MKKIRKTKNQSFNDTVGVTSFLSPVLKREFEVGSEEYNQASRGFCPSKKSNLLRVTILYKQQIK